MNWHALIGMRLGGQELADFFGLSCGDSDLIVRAIANLSQAVILEAERLREEDKTARRARKIEEAKKLLREEGLLP